MTEPSANRTRTKTSAPAGELASSLIFFTASAAGRASIKSAPTKRASVSRRSWFSTRSRVSSAQ